MLYINIEHFLNEIYYYKWILIKNIAEYLSLSIVHFYNKEFQQM